MSAPLQSRLAKLEAAAAPALAPLEGVWLVGVKPGPAGPVDLEPVLVRWTDGGER